jgi:hypothetical protein
MPVSLKSLENNNKKAMEIKRDTRGKETETRHCDWLHTKAI